MDLILRAHGESLRSGDPEPPWKPRVPVGTPSAGTVGFVSKVDRFGYSPMTRRMGSTPGKRSARAMATWPSNNAMMLTRRGVIC